MLIRLLPAQLVKIWDMIRFAIAETFIPRSACTASHLQYILKQLLCGKMDCWIAFDGTTKEDRKFTGFVTTRIGIDGPTGEKILWIDSVYAYQSVHFELMARVMGTLEAYAVKQDCKTIIAMTDTDRIATLAEKNGFVKRFQMIKEINHG